MKSIETLTWRSMTHFSEKEEKCGGGRGIRVRGCYICTGRHAEANNEALTLNSYF